MSDNVQFDAPAAILGPVAVQLINATQFDARCTVEMTVRSEQVHRVERTVPAGTLAVVIGPDSAEQISITTVLEGASNFEIDPVVLVLGTDFQAGALIPYEIVGPEPPAVVTPPPPPPVVPEKPAPPVLIEGFLSGLDANVKVEAGALIEFALLSTGVNAATTFTLFANPDGIVGNGDELVVASGTATGNEAIAWDTTGVEPDTYTIYAELTDPGRFRRTELAPGTVRILEQLAIGPIAIGAGPVEPGAPLSIEVTVSGADPNAVLTITAVADEPTRLRGRIEIEIDTVRLPVSMPIATEWLTDPNTPAAVFDIVFALDDKANNRTLVDDGNFVEVLPRLAIFISSLSDIEVAPGASVDIGVTTSGFVSGRPVFSLFAEPNDSAPLLIVPNVPATGSATITWDTSNLSPGVYEIFGRLRDGARFAESQRPSPMNVIISAVPTLLIIDPNAPKLLLPGDPLRVSWIAHDPDNDATFAFYLDVDSTRNGNEIRLPENFYEDEEPIGSRVYDTTSIPVGTYFLLGVIQDLASTVEVYGAQVCITNSLNGVFSPSDFGAFEIAEIAGLDPNTGVSNVAFGAALDISHDLSGDGVHDVLIGDPGATHNFFEVISKTGAVYYEQSGAWPRNLNVDALRNRIVGTQDNAGFGAALAFTDAFTPGPGQLMIGAPSFALNGVPGTENGLTYFVRGQDLLGPPGDIDPNQSATTVRGNTNTIERLGSAVASVGDVDGDLSTDVAFSGPIHTGNAGRVAILSGQIPGLPHGSLDNLGPNFPGVIFEGEALGDLAGFALTGIGNFDQDPAGRQDMLVGAPGADSGAGRVYLLLGDAGIFVTPSRSLAEVGTPQQPGFVFLGENPSDGKNPGDRAGYAVSYAHVNGDAAPDLLIGAPGWSNNRGRVYVIYAQPGLPSVISLADVGVSIMGAVIDGLAPGDRFGQSLGRGSDFNNDGFEEIAGGAPSFDDGRGATFIIYGSDSRLGSIPLDTLGSCGNEGLMLVGDNFGDQFGFAIGGGGDVNSDAYGDYAIGAPGANRAYILFGRPAQSTPPPCQADLDGSGRVDLADLSLVLTEFGQVGGGLPGDVDGDGDVDLSDLSILLNEFGRDCPAP